MPAYLIANTEEIFDLEGMRLYVEGVIPLMAAYGGKYVVSSFAIERLEGTEPVPLAAAVAEFPSLEKLRAFWTSKEHAPLKELRHKSMRVNLIIADVPGQE
jgi:uncharacterized protein (DUF1330 family)